MKEYVVANLELADNGLRKIKWAENDMPVLRQKIAERFRKEQPLKGVKIAACLHVTTETANLMITLKEGGADVRLTASNPLSTQDDVAAALVEHFEIPTFAIKGEGRDMYYENIEHALAFGPQVTMDDGADLVSTLHSTHKEMLDDIIGGTEETTTGVIRLRAMARSGVLKYPIIAVNDAYTKHLFDNRYGTGQSALDGIIRATNKLIAGLTFVVAGYGWCGRGVAQKARGLGAQVVVTEVDPLKALEAHMDGFRVMPMIEAAAIGDIFCTLTGDKNVITKEHFLEMKDGAIVSNAGHFNVEIDMLGLEDISTGRREVRPMVMEYKLKNGRRIYVITEGRLVNLSAAEGHPASVMDMSFANQALSVEYIVKNRLKPDVYTIPYEIDLEIARLKLQALGVRIDTLTDEQKQYLDSWQEGT